MKDLNNKNPLTEDQSDIIVPTQKLVLSYVLPTNCIRIL